MSSTRTQSRTVVIVVNYRTPDRVCALLDSIVETGSLPLGLVIVDNASGDGGVEAIQAHVETRALSSWVRVYGLEENLGFAGGNNAAIERGRAVWPDAEAWFLLNPDTLVKKGTIAELDAVLRENPRAGIVGSQLEDPAGSPECAGHVGDGPMWQLATAASSRWVDRLLGRAFERVVAPPATRRCDWVSGAALMVRDAALRDVGPMDDRFFLYFEEVDFCRRVRRARWQVWLVPSSRVVHFEGSSTGISTGRVPAYWFASRRRYFRKHFGTTGLVAADVAWLAGRGVRLISNLVTGRRVGALPERFLRDLVTADALGLLGVKES